MQGGTAAVERVFREEYGRLIASLVRRFGDIEIAEEAAGEALVAALESGWRPVPSALGPAGDVAVRMSLWPSLAAELNLTEAAARTG